LYFQQIRTGRRMLIQRLGDSPTKGLLCRIEIALPDSDEIILYAPIEHGRLVVFEADERCTLRLLTETATYRFNSQYIRHEDIDGFDVVRFKLIGQGEKLQRRSAFRFSCNLPVQFSIVYSSGQQSPKEKGVISDLSAGGAKMYSNSKLQSGFLLNISLEFGDDLVVTFGEVRTITTLRAGEDFTYQYGVRFTLIPEIDQEKIISYMYKMQREELKKARIR